MRRAPTCTLAYSPLATTLTNATTHRHPLETPQISSSRLPTLAGAGAGAAAAASALPSLEAQYALQQPQQQLQPQQQQQPELSLQPPLHLQLPPQQQPQLWHADAADAGASTAAAVGAAAGGGGPAQVAFEVTPAQLDLVRAHAQTLALLSGATLAVDAAPAAAPGGAPRLALVLLGEPAALQGCAAMVARLLGGGGANGGGGV